MEESSVFISLKLAMTVVAKFLVMITNCINSCTVYGALALYFGLSFWQGHLHYNLSLEDGYCLRPYHTEYTSSRLITEVKQRRACPVLGWVTAWEQQVL